MSVPRLTTPTFVLTFPTSSMVDLTAADDVYVTFGFRNEILTKTGSDLTVAEKTVSVYLTQNETRMFPVGDIQIQVNWMVDGSRFASDIVKYHISENLLNRVVGDD